jgi:hypothetical protein
MAKRKAADGCSSIAELPLLRKYAKYEKVTLENRWASSYRLV